MAAITIVKEIKIHTNNITPANILVSFMINH